MRPHIGGLVPKWLGGARDIHAGGENTARWCHMADLTEPRAGTVLRQMIDNIGSDKPEPEVPGLVHDIEQNDLWQQVRDIKGFDIPALGKAAIDDLGFPVVQSKVQNPATDIPGDIFTQ